MSAYRIANFDFTPEAENFQAILEKAHGKKCRAACLCSPAKPEMYVALINGEFYLRRMPGTGAQHDPTCGSFDPPPELSGLGQLTGAAIVTEANGDTDLKLDFSLSIRGGRSVPPGPINSEATSAEAPKNKLTLLGTLHYLWDTADLTKWRPEWKRRSWWIIHRELTAVAARTNAKKHAFSSVLYVPPMFNKDSKDAQVAERRKFMHGLYPAKGKPVPLGIVVAPFKEVTHSQYGKKITFKHIPDFSFFMDERLAEKFDKLMKDNIHQVEANPDNHLILIATFSVSSNYAKVQEIAGMLVNKHWIPFDGEREELLVTALEDRAFAKCMKYNLRSDAPVANALLLDTDKPIALYTPPEDTSDEDEAILHEIAKDCVFPPWFWLPDQIDMPELPAVGGRAP